MSNIMLDLETMGTGSNAAIVAIGAVKFNSKGLGEEFYCVVNLNSSVEAGLVIDPDTVMWWLGQSDDAREALTHDPGIALSTALSDFRFFIGAKREAKIWGNGASFDNPILANAYRAVGQEQPWNFWNDCCYRTVKNLLGGSIEFEKPTIPHHALEDAKAQALHLIKILALVGK